MHIAEAQNISVRFVPFKYNNVRLKQVKAEVRIGVRIGMNFDEYEEQADRAAKMLLLALSM